MEELSMVGSTSRPLVLVRDLLSGDVLANHGDVGILVRMETMVDSVLEDLRGDVDAQGLSRAGAVLKGAIGALEGHLNNNAAIELHSLLGPVVCESPTSLRLSYAQFSGWLAGALLQEGSRAQVVGLGEVITKAFGPT